MHFRVRKVRKLIRNGRREMPSLALTKINNLTSHVSLTKRENYSVVKLINAYFFWCEKCKLKFLIKCTDFVLYFITQIANGNLFYFSLIQSI